MTTGRQTPFFQQLRQAVLAHDGAGLTDAELMSRFVAQRDGAALEALIRRHGSMVWSVCRRVLSNEQDAEDAFQASFLVLVRNAASIRPREQVGNWLYGTAYRTALKARTTDARRRARERRAAEMIPTQAEADADWSDLLPVLDQELNRLPDKYRTALVLCELEGRSRKEAARQLGIPEGTLSSRLATGRRMLAKRLGRPGLALSAGALAATTAVPPSLMASTVKTSSLVAAGTAAAGVVSVRVAALAEGVVRAMFLSKLTVGAALLAVVAVLAAGAGGAAYCAAAAAPKPQPQTPPVAAVQAKEKDVNKDDGKGEAPPPWGEAVDGVQARLRPAEARWDAGAPPEFILDLRNQGEKEPYQCRVPNFCMIEWDGKWYRWGGSDELECKSTVLEPGKQIDDWVKVSLKVPWLKGRPESIKGSEPLEISAGKHKLRVSFTFEPAGFLLDKKGLKTEVVPNIKREQGIFVVSQVVNVEVGKESAWGEAADGVEARIRTPKIVWTEGEAPMFSLDLRNQGQRRPHGLRIPFDAEIEVDGTWYLYGGPIDFKAADTPLPSHRQIDDWVKVTPDKYWTSKSANPVRGPKDHLSLPPGKHTIRLAFRLEGDKPIRPVTGPLEVEIVKKDEPVWGDAVDGVQARIRTAKPVWGSKEAPTFSLDLRNQGKKTPDQRRVPLDCQIEVDKVWYSFELPSGPYVSVGFPLKPGEQVNDWTIVTPDEHWTSLTPEKKRFPLPPGKHTIRIAYQLQGTTPAIRPISGPLEIEISKLDESAWGEAVDGVQVRLRVSKLPGGAPGSRDFALDVRNQGEHDVGQCRVPNFCEVEWDGKWYTFPNTELDCKAFNLAAGKQVDDWVKTSLDENWERLPGRKGDDPPSRGYVMAEALTVAPGKHTVRVAFVFNEKIRPISQPAVFELGKESEWGEAVDGVQARIRTPRVVWAAGEEPTFHLDLRNQGKKTPDQRRVPYDCQIEVDKVWYSFDEPSGPYVSVGDPLKPGWEVDDWTIVSPDKDWGSFPGKAQHFPLPPGKHTIRIAYQLQGTTPAIRPISGQLEIEVSVRPAAEVPAAGGKAPPAKEFAPPALGRKGSRLVPVVSAKFDKVPLAEALANLADESGTNVILAAYAAKEGETKVTANLTGVPLDTAVIILADMADLKLVRLGNVYYVTSRAARPRLEAEEQKRLTKENKQYSDEPGPPANKTDADK